jgi:tRNA U55 pseudouridine synthase TruB
MRSLARDIGLALGVGGYCSKLTRRQVGPFELASAVALQDLDPTRDLLDPLLALADMPKITLDPSDVARLALGQSVELEGAQVDLPAGGPAELAVLSPRGELVAIAAMTQDGRHLRPRKVFTT